MSEEQRPKNPFEWLKRTAWLILGSIFALWLAIQLLAQIWGWLLIIAVIAAAVAATVAWMRHRNHHW